MHFNSSSIVLHQIIVNCSLKNENECIINNIVFIILKLLIHMKNQKTNIMIIDKFFQKNYIIIFDILMELNY